MNVTNPISLEQRLQNVKASNLTELNAIRNIISKIILIPFSDFMFFHQKEYLLIMTEFTNHEQTSDFPNVITGQVFEYIVRRIGKYIKTDEAVELLNAINQPFLDLYDKAKGRVSDPFSMDDSFEELIEASPWKYVQETFTSSLGNIPLKERIQNIERSNDYKAVAYLGNIHNLLIPSKMGFPFYNLLYSTTFKDYYTCLQSLSYTKITPIKVTYNKLLQAKTGFSPDKTILEYYVQQDLRDFAKNIYSLFVYPMAQVSRSMFINYCKKNKSNKKGN